jgi:Arc/MetJ-type ribon-helix-helix transcriptional regulator
MYLGRMKTITITIPDELDAEAVAEAKRLGISKSELIRRGITALLPDRDVDRGEDPWRRLAGFASPDLSADADDIDRTIYDT